MFLFSITFFNVKNTAYVTHVSLLPQRVCAATFVLKLS